MHLQSSTRKREKGKDRRSPLVHSRKLAEHDNFTCTTQHNTTQHNTTQHNTTQHNTTQHNTTQHNTTQHNTTQHNTTQHNTTQHNTTQHNTTQHNTTQHSTIQYNTIQYNTIQYNTIQYNREVKLDVYGKRQTAKIKLLPSVFSPLYSGIKIFVFAVNSKRHVSIFA